MAASWNPRAPASLRFETATAKIDFPPELSESRRDLKALACLAYWGRPLTNEKTKESDRVEIHVRNSCLDPIQASRTWFTLRVQFDSTVETWSQDTTARFLEDVPAGGEIAQILPAKVKKDMRTRVEGWGANGLPR